MPETELQFTSRVIEWLRREDFKVFHVQDSRYVTGKGWPDLIFTNGKKVYAREIKSKKGKLSKHQQVWLECLATAGIDTGVWRVHDNLSDIAKELEIQ